MARSSPRWVRRAGRTRPEPGSGLDLDDLGPLVDRAAAALDGAGQTADEPARVHRRVLGPEDRAAGAFDPDPVVRLRPRRAARSGRHRPAATSASQCASSAGSWLESAGDDEAAALDVAGVDALVRADAADLVDTAVDGVLDGRHTVASEPALEVGRRHLQAGGAPATVPTGRPEPGDLALEDRDLEARIPAEQLVGRPQTRVARAEDRDIGVGRAVERRPRGQVVLGRSRARSSSRRSRAGRPSSPARSGWRAASGSNDSVRSTTASAPSRPRRVAPIGSPRIDGQPDAGDPFEGGHGRRDRRAGTRQRRAARPERSERPTASPARPRGGPGRRHGLGGGLVARGPEDEPGLTGDRQHRAEDGWPGECRARPGDRLLERERVLGQDRPADGDLGDRGGGRSTLLEQPGRQRADEEATGRYAVAAGRGRCRRAGAPAPGRRGSWRRTAHRG